jgi:spore germination protein
MGHYPRTTSPDRHQQTRLISRPLPIIIGTLVLLVLWVVLVVNTLNVWQQRQVTTEARRLQAAQATLLSLTTVDNTPAIVASTQESGSALITQPQPSSRPSTMIHPKTGQYITAWLPTSFDAEAARSSFEANKDILDEVSPFWYTTRPNDGALLPETGARDRSLVKAAHDANVLVIPTIHNVVEPGAIGNLLADPELRSQHIAAIIAEIRAYDYDGIDIDYEALPRNSRDHYSAFMEELASALHTEGKLFTVAVHAKTEDGGGLGAFQDWALLGRVCDRVRIMTYDYHWSGGASGPIAPVSWAKSVVSYGLSQIPAYKLQVGVPFYGYDWGATGRAAARTWTDVQDLIETHLPEVNFAASNQDGPVYESWFTYRYGGEQRTLWFADHRSLEAKLALVEEQSLAGIAIWRLGNEDPENWRVIRERVNRHPLVLQRMINDSIPEH